MGNEGKIILDNGGSITLQLGDFAHFYEDEKQAAEDIAAWLKSADTSSWEGHEDDAAACAPTAEDIRNGGYRVVTLDRSVDNLADLAAELSGTGWGNGEELGDILSKMSEAKHTHPTDAA